MLEVPKLARREPMQVCLPILHVQLWKNRETVSVPVPPQQWEKDSTPTIYSPRDKQQPSWLTAMSHQAKFALFYPASIPAKKISFPT